MEFYTYSKRKEITKYFFEGLHPVYAVNQNNQFPNQMYPDQMYADQMYPNEMYPVYENPCMDPCFCYWNLCENQVYFFLFEFWRAEIVQNMIWLEHIFLISH